MTFLKTEFLLCTVKSQLSMKKRPEPGYPSRCSNSDIILLLLCSIQKSQLAIWKTLKI